MNLTTEINLARNGLGDLLTERNAARLRAVVEAPSQRTWEAAHCIVLNRGGMTLWQAVCALDESFTWIGKTYYADDRPSEPWKRIPRSDLIMEAIRYATH